MCPTEAASRPAGPAAEWLRDGAVVLRGLALPAETSLASGIASVLAASPFRRVHTPRGQPLSVEMTNCGDVGWVSDRRGYRYEPLDPLQERPWPPLPAGFASLASEAATAAGFPGFTPDACLVNRYVPGAQMGLHQDRDERDFTAPIVSVSLGIPAVFRFGGDTRGAPARSVLLAHGDVVVWGGPARLAFHGVLRVKAGSHPFAGGTRINLTFRKAL